MNISWTGRNTIVANLFNPAFCGEIIRACAKEYNKHTNSKFPYAYAFIILPIVLHEATRERMPRSVRTYFFVWVEKNDDLFFDFSKRTRSMVKYTKEALSFLLAHNKIEFNDNAEIIASDERVRKINPNLKVYYSPDLFIYHRERQLNGYLLQRMCFGMDFLNLIKPSSGVKGFQPILPILIFLSINFDVSIWQ